MKRPPKKTATPSIEDEKLMMDILFQLNKMKQNQIEFKNAICDFFDEMYDDNEDEQINRLIP